MSEVTVIGTKDKAELPDALFNVQTNVPLIHQVVVAQLAAARQGTHDTKTRGEVSGGGAKPWRQKGTGRARQGSRRAPQWTGGGTVHGPTPRSYAQRTPKKMIAAALFGALSDRARDGRVHVIATIVEGETPSTKEALKSLAAVESAKVLVVLSRDEEIAWMSLRNVASVHVIVVDQLNAYDVLVADDVVFTTAALDVFVTRQPTSSHVVTAAEDADADVEPESEPVETKPEPVEAAEPVAESVETAEPVEAEVIEAPVVEAAAKSAKAKSAKAESAEVVEPEPVDEPAPKKPASRARKAPAEAKDYGPGSYRGDTPPEGYDIKGNEDSMKFHAPDSPWYGRTIAEVWFDSAEAAEAAGFVNAHAHHDADEEGTK